MPPAGDGCPLCAEHVATGGDHLMVLLNITEDDYRLGEWCPHCALPSAVAFPITVRCDHGWPQAMVVADVVVCLDCGATIAPLIPPHPTFRTGEGWPG